MARAPLSSALGSALRICQASRSAFERGCPGAGGGGGGGEPVQLLINFEDLTVPPGGSYALVANQPYAGQDVTFQILAPSTEVEVFEWDATYLEFFNIPQPPEGNKFAGAPSYSLTFGTPTYDRFTMNKLSNAGEMLVYTDTSGASAAYTQNFAGASGDGTWFALVPVPGHGLIKKIVLTAQTGGALFIDDLRFSLGPYV